MRVDFGTGDGSYVLRAARKQPDVLHIGVDANVDGLREVSHRASRKPAKGGASNAIFGVLALDDAPGALDGLADSLTVLLPWGSLLRAVATADLVALTRLRAICRLGADVRFVFGYGAHADAAAMTDLGLPSLANPTVFATLESGFAAGGFVVAPRPVPVAEIRELPTTWAKKLAYSGKDRTFVELTGRVR